MKVGIFLWCKVESHVKSVKSHRVSAYVIELDLFHTYQLYIISIIKKIIVKT